MRSASRAGFALGFVLPALWIGQAFGFSPDRLTQPWPKDADAAGQAITFPSHSPFALEDVGRGPDRDPPVKARARLYLPKRAAQAPRAPAVILLHGAGGVLSNRELRYGPQLAEMGVAALVIDVFGARGGRGQRFTDRLLKITEAMFLADAYSGLKYLAARSDIDGNRIAVMGFSYGAMASVFAAYDQVAARYSRRGPRFAAHISFYGPCIARFADSRTTRAPVLMLMGDGDAITDRSRCNEVAGDLRKGGSQVRAVVYRGAYHQWDGNFRGPFMIGRNIADCRYWVHGDGTIRDLHTFLPMSSEFLRKVTLGLCADRNGYLIGADERIREKSNQDVGRLLAEAFAQVPAGASRLPPVNGRGASIGPWPARIDR